METIEHAVVIRPFLGERVSGDAAFAAPCPSESGDGFFCAIVDGLGHGPSAHAASARVVELLADFASPEVAEVLLKLDAQLRESVGAAVGLCHIDLTSGLLRYAGVGNTVTRRFGSQETTLVSRGGVVGLRMRPPRQETLSLASGDVVVMHTDGVSERFGPRDYPEILGHAPRVVAGQIVRRFGKSHDDAGVLVLRYRP